MKSIWPNPTEAPDKGEPVCRFGLPQISKSLSFRLSGLVPSRLHREDTCRSCPGMEAWLAVLEPTQIPRSATRMGYLFVGQSGGGKATTARLGQKARGIRDLSDDRIILWCLEARIRMCGARWHGEAKPVVPRKLRQLQSFIWAAERTTRWVR